MGQIAMLKEHGIFAWNLEKMIWDGISIQNITHNIRRLEKKINKTNV